MAKTRRRKGAGATDGPTTVPTGSVQTTGRYLVLFREGASKEAMNVLSKNVGIGKMVRSADFKSGAVDIEAVPSEAGLVLDQLGVAVVSASPEQFQIMSAAAGETSAIEAVEPEQIMYAIMGGSLDPGGASGSFVSVSTEYLRGFRDGVSTVYSQLTGAGPAAAALVEAEAAFADTAQLTWGLQATRVASSRATGAGIRVAVLDTGFDLRHPDFRVRPIVSQSFISGQTVQDGNGHGTHCIGTAMGPLQPPQPPGVRRYGCAHGASIFVGKVLSNQGSGADAGILAGINWAIQNQCRVISMSLGAPVQPGEPFSPVYENVARRALQAGCLIVAAAGNDSDRRVGNIRPVGRPANCPSIMAVAAVDSNLQIAFFSNRGVNPNGGQVDIAGPGVAVFSSWPMAQRYNTISGTSMATPHVAGIAAMHSQSQGVTGVALFQTLQRTARRLVMPSADVGAGLVQAP